MRVCVCVIEAAANCSFSTPGCISFASFALLVTSNFACFLFAVLVPRFRHRLRFCFIWFRFPFRIVIVVVVVALCVQCVGKMQRNCLSISRKCFGACNWRHSSFVLPAAQQVRPNRNTNRYITLSIKK